MKKNTIKEQADKLNRCIRDFAGCIDSLPEALFLKKMDGWTPRDVTAHLIGWNLHTIKGCQQLRKGELPFYFIDPGEDFCKINALLVREYASEDRAELLARLDASAEKLKRFLIAVDPDDWENNFGVTSTHNGEAITIRNSIDALIIDYVIHREQIEAWAGKVATGVTSHRG
jgi:hypothetical protein